MYQLLHGVKAMHEHGILHRVRTYPLVSFPMAHPLDRLSQDLKPGNLLVNKDCELKVREPCDSHASLQYLIDPTLTLRTLP